MRNILLLSTLAVGTLFVTGAIAQHEGHEGHNAPPAAEQPAATPAKGEMAGEMTGEMTGEMKGGMMAEHAEVAKLADRLVNGFAAIENETNATALKAKLAEHGKLLKELQAKLQGKTQMMEQMHGQMKEKMMVEHQKQ